MREKVCEGIDSYVVFMLSHSNLTEKDEDLCELISSQVINKNWASQLILYFTIGAMSKKEPFFANVLFEVVIDN